MLLVDGNLTRLSQSTDKNGGVIVSAQVDLSIRKVPQQTLKGMVSGGFLIVVVIGFDHRSSALVGSTATLAVFGPVSVHARLCGTTLTLQNLEVRHAKPSAPPTGTTTTSTTP